MLNINYEKRVVAFVDVLGFSSVVNESTGSFEKLSVLNELVNLLEKAIPDLNKAASVKEEFIPKHTYISDSIILSAPLVHTNNYDGLVAVVLRTIQLTQLLLSKGYLVRGGISIVDVWHEESNIVGPAYQDAYKIETTSSIPCIMFTQEAKDHWNDILKDWGAHIEDMFRELPSGVLIVNGLSQHYIETNPIEGTSKKGDLKYSLAS